MSIKELIEAAKRRPITPEQVGDLRNTLQKSNGKTTKSSSNSEQFLDRTYSL